MISINRNLYSAWVEKSIKASLIAGSPCTIQQSDVPPECESIYNPGHQAKLRKVVLFAIFKFINIYSDTECKSGAYGTFTYQKDGVEKIGEAIEIIEGLKREVAVIENGKLYAICKDGSDYVSYTHKDGYDNGVLLLTAVLFHEIIIANNPEVCKCMTDILTPLVNGRSFTIQDIPMIAKNAAIISENLYRKTTSATDEYEIKILNENGNVLKLIEMKISAKKYLPVAQKGKFEVLADDINSSVDNSNVAPKEDNSDFLKDRIFSEEEKRLIPEIPSWYIKPDLLNEMVGLVKNSTGTTRPKRNFMFRGPSSTGKSSLARAIAATLGIPYVFITCSADTESSTFLGEPMYDKEGKVRYVESPFISAIKNGWLVEVQEPFVIAKQAVMTALNGILDDSNGVTLPTGEFIKRHPDSIVVMTTNVSYVGCKKPNQSVLRRMDNIYDVEMPVKSEIRDRIIANTGYTDRKIIDKMIDCAFKVIDKLKSEMIDDGVCGVSEMIGWVSTLLITKDIISAAKSTIVAKATDDPLEQGTILAIIESCFGNVKYKSCENVKKEAVQM